VKPTTWQTLASAVVVSTVVGWFFARLLEVRRGEVALPPWSAAVVLTAAGVALIYTARHTKARLARRPGTTPLPPLVAARLAALGLAGSRAGALVGGAYLGYAAYVAADLATDYRREVLWRSTACVGGAAVVVIGSLLLERALRLPESEPSDDNDSGIVA
jgi:hypothetical protein